MITSPLGYLSFIAFIAGFFYLLEKRSSHKIFDYLPSIVLVYIFSMIGANSNLWIKSNQIANLYVIAKNNLLPAILFLMLLQVNLKEFFSLGKKILIAFFSSILSISFSFILVVLLFDFTQAQGMAFGALSGSWMGGTANMVAVATALNVDEAMMGYVLIVDAVNYTLWVIFLLAIVKISSKFNSWSRSESFTDDNRSCTLGCSCDLGKKRYWQLIIMAIIVSLISQFISTKLGFLSSTTWLVIIATIFGILGSFTKISKINGSEQIASTMLFLLVALIGSRATLSGVDQIPIFISAGTLILLIHALFMIASAKIFKLDLFSISVASLSCIGGIASAPILAAAYHRSLIGVAVLMAIMGYLVGTFAGLAVGTILMKITT